MAIMLKIVTFIFLFFYILGDTASPDLNITKTDKYKYSVKFSNTPNVASYNFTVPGLKILDVLYKGANNKTVDYNRETNDVIVYDLTNNTVGSGEVEIVGKSYGINEVSLKDVVCATPLAEEADIDITVNTFRIKNARSIKRDGNKRTVIKPH